MAALVILVLLAAGGLGGFALYANRQRALEAEQVAAGQSALVDKAWAEAEAGFSRALAVPVQWRRYDLESWLGRGVARFEQGNFDGALADFDAVTAANKGVPEPYAYRTRIYWQQGRTDAALAEGALARALDDRLALPYALQALTALQARQWDQAARLASAALERDNQQALAYRVRGTVRAWKWDLAGALQDLTQAVALAPRDVEALAMQAYVALQLETDDEAAAAVDQARAVAPGSVPALWAEALLRFEQYDVDQARSLADRAIALDDTRPELFVLRGESINQTADEPEALADFERALELDPDFAPALSAAATLRHDRGITGSLQVDGERLIELAPAMAEGYLLLAKYYSDEGDESQELVYLEQAVAARPENPRGYAQRGYYYLEAGEHDKAQADFEQARQLAPGHVGPLVGLASVAADQQDYAGALELLTQALKIDPKNRVALLTQGWVSYYQPDAVAALASAQAALALDPDLPGALLLHARINYDDGDTSTALADLGRLMQVRPRNADALGLRALTYQLAGQPDPARDDAQAALAFDPDQLDAHFALAWLALEAEDWQDLLIQAYPLVKLAPDDSRGYLLRGQAHARLAHYTEAQADLETAVRLQPDLAEAYQELGAVFYVTGRIEDAIDAYGLALDHARDVNEIDQYESLLAFLRSIPPLKDGFRTVVDETRGFSLTYPNTWYQVQPNSDAQALQLLRVKAGGIVYIVAAVQDDFIGFSARTVAEALAKEAAGRLPGFEVVASEPTTAGGLSGWRFKARFTVQSISFYGVYYVFVRGDRGGVLSLEGDLGMYETYLPEMETIAATFGFLP